MKKIQQEAIRRFGTLDCREAELFIEGACWADSEDRWRSVEDELPPLGEEVLTRWHHLVQEVIIYNADHLQTHICNGDFSHWRPMPEVPKFIRPALPKGERHITGNDPRGYDKEGGGR